MNFSYNGHVKKHAIHVLKHRVLSRLLYSTAARYVKQSLSLEQEEIFKVF